MRNVLLVPLLGLSMLFGLTNTGSTADAAVGEVAVSTYDWTGFYVGAQAGGSWANFHQTNEFFLLPDGDADGWLLGAYVGHYWQVNSFVVGAELGANWRDVEGINDIGNDPERLRTWQNWDASVVAKVGMPVDNLLLYALGGVTLSEFESQYVGHDLGDSTKGSDTVWGWTLGVGAEMAFSQELRGRLEYRFADYAEADVTCTICGPTGIDAQTHTLAVGLSYGW